MQFPCQAAEGSAPLCGEVLGLWCAVLCNLDETQVSYNWSWTSSLQAYAAFNLNLTTDNPEVGGLRPKPKVLNTRPIITPKRSSKGLPFSVNSCEPIQSSSTVSGVLEPKLRIILQHGKGMVGPKDLVVSQNKGGPCINPQIL